MQPIITINGVEYIHKGSTIPHGSQFDKLRDAYLDFGIQDRINIEPVDGKGMLQAYELIDGSYQLANASTDRSVAHASNLY